MKQSFIVGLWSGLFNILVKLSPFYWVCMSIPVIRRDYKAVYYRDKPRISGIYHYFVEWWALGNSLLSCTLLIVASVLNMNWGEFVCVAYGMTRVYDIVTTQIDTLLFRVYRIRKIEAQMEKEGVPYTSHAIRGNVRIVVLILQNYAELIFWFALFYHYWAWAFFSQTESLSSLFTLLTFSFNTMTTFGATSVNACESWGRVLVFVQSIIGLFMALMILSRFISFLPWSRSMDEIENTEPNPSAGNKKPRDS